MMFTDPQKPKRESSRISIRNTNGMKVWNQAFLTSVWFRSHGPNALLYYKALALRDVWYSLRKKVGCVRSFGMRSFGYYASLGAGLIWNEVKVDDSSSRGSHLISSVFPIIPGCLSYSWWASRSSGIAVRIENGVSHLLPSLHLPGGWARIESRHLICNP